MPCLAFSSPRVHLRAWGRLLESRKWVLVGGLLLGCSGVAAPPGDVAPPSPIPPAAEAVPAAEPAGSDADDPSLEAEAGPSAWPGSPEVAAYLNDPEALATGHRFFGGVCTGYCHSTRPEGNREAPDLFDCNWDHGDQDADLFRVIAEGVPDTRMQGFQGKLPDSELWKIVAYLRSRSRCTDNL